MTLYIYIYTNLITKEMCFWNLRSRLPPSLTHPTETKVQKITIWIISYFFVYYFLLCSSLWFRLIATLNDWMRVNIELERTRKEVAAALFKVYKFSTSRHLPELIEKNHETRLDILCVCVCVCVCVRVFLHINSTCRSACKILQGA